MSELRLGPRRPPVPAGTPKRLGWPETVWRLVVLLAVLAGIGVRVWSVLGPRSRLSSDEAIEGLMAAGLLHHGTITAFYWGQWYGGTAEAVLVAGIMRVVGETTAAMILVQYAEGALAAVLVWRIGLRTLDAGRAALAGALAWVWPVAFVLFQSRPFTFYQLTVCSGLVVLLMALRVGERPAGRLSWAMLGLAAGLAFWTSPQSLYYLLPVCIWLPGRLGLRQLRHGWPAPLLAVVGAGPWLLSNIAHGWPSLQANSAVQDSARSRLLTLLDQGLPVSLGLRLPNTLAWVGPEGELGYQLAVVVLAVVGVQAVRRNTGRLLLVRMGPLYALVLVIFPVVYAAIPAVAHVGNGRYFIFLGAPLAIAFSSLAATPVVRAAVLAGCTALTLVAFPKAVATQTDPGSTKQLSQALLGRGITFAYAGYWTSYKLTWESRERVIASPMLYVRYRHYDEQVATADRIAVVYSDSDHEQPQAAAMRVWLTATGTSFVEARARGYDIYLPDRDLSRAEIPPEARAVP